MMKIENVAILGFGIVIILLLLLIVFLLVIKFGGQIVSKIYSDLRYRSTRRSMRKSFNKSAFLTHLTPPTRQHHDLLSSKILVTEDNIRQYTNRYDVTLLTEGHNKPRSMLPIRLSDPSVYNIHYNLTAFNKERNNISTALPQFLNI